MPEPIIQIAGVFKRYPGAVAPALRDVSLDIRRGETFGVIGPNGAGKTTLMGCLLGLLSPDDGVITIDGLAPDDLAVRAATGYLPERLTFDRWMTGREFLCHHHVLALRPADRRRRDVDSAFEAVGLEREARDRGLKAYSRGMLQRLGFAQAIIGRPRIVYLDEPTSGMDPVGVATIRALVDELKADGVTIVLNSHQLDQVERFCDRVAYVRGGVVESMEVLSAASASRRVVRVRAASAFPSDRRLEAMARRAEGRYLGTASGWARFSVTGDEASAALVRSLVRGRVAVVEVVPESSRLERLFFKAGGPKA